MATLKLLRRPIVKNILQTRSFFIKSAGQSMACTGTSPLRTIGPVSRPAPPATIHAALGIHVSDVLDLPIVQQPEGDDGYVSPSDGQLTEYRIPSKFGNVGLLAHNDLSGRFFHRLSLGREVQLLYGNDSVETFVITDILRYQALQPDSPYSPFRDLSTGETLTVTQLFKKVYMGSRHITFQTCIAAQRNLVWGRLFVIAAHKHSSASHRWN